MARFFDRWSHFFEIHFFFSFQDATSTNGSIGTLSVGPTLWAGNNAICSKKKSNSNYLVLVWEQTKKDLKYIKSSFFRSYLMFQFFSVLLPSETTIHSITEMRKERLQQCIISAWFEPWQIESLPLTFIVPFLPHSLKNPSFLFLSPSSISFLSRN